MVCGRINFIGFLAVTRIIYQAAIRLQLFNSLLLELFEVLVWGCNSRVKVFAFMFLVKYAAIILIGRLFVYIQLFNSLLLEMFEVLAWGCNGRGRVCAVAARVSHLLETVNHVLWRVTAIAGAVTGR